MSDNRCMICGARLGDNNTSGIGFGCLENVVKPARSEVYREFCALKIWIEKAQYVRSIFIDRYKDTKFRSEFKKSFYASMSVSERISKKQLEIMTRELEYSRIFPDLKHITDKSEDMINAAIHQNPEFYTEAIDKHRKLYLSGRKNKTEE